jgi:exopolyphosphatase/guanosine-5'-triphosphate,3'-diphosphate pyrophosphatase
VEVTERFGLADRVDKDALAAALDALARDLAVLDSRPSPELVVGMGGALTNLAAVKHELTTYDSTRVQARARPRGAGRADPAQSHAERRGASVDRRPAAEAGDTILAGACIVHAVLTDLGSGSVVSERGLRHRLLVEGFGA